MTVDERGNRPTNRIGRRLLTRVLLISLVITVFFTAIQAWIDYRSRLVILQDNLEHVRYGELGGIVTALWHFDRQQIQALVEGLDHIRYVNYAAVLDNGVVVSEAGVRQDKNILIQKIPLVREHDGRRVQLGILYMQADTSEVFRDVVNNIIIIFLFQAVTVAIVAFFLLILFERLVTRHLSAAADFFRSFELDRLHIPLSLDKRRYNDEIDILADAFNQMLKNLNEVITERKKLEVCLINAKGDWERTFDSVEDPIMLLNNDFVIMRTNRAMARLLGTTPRETVGLTCDEVVLSTHGSHAVCPYADMLVDGSTHTTEVHDEVRGRYYLISVSPVLDSDGEMTGAIHISKDVTSLKLAEEGLLSKQKALESVYGLATTLGGSFESICNRVVISLSDLLGVSHVMIQHVEEGKASVISFVSDGGPMSGGELFLEDYPCSSVYTDRKAQQMQGLLKGRFSTIHDLKSIVCVPVISASGDLVGVIDVMDRKDRIYSDEEIHLIEIFSSYIAFEIERKKMELRLFKIQEMETIGKIASGVAHEVRNPLNAIMALSEALVSEGASTEENTFLLHIRAQVERLSQLMSDLLNVGKPIEAENMQRVSIWELCSGAADSWKQSAYGKTHRVNVITNPLGTSPEVEVDTQRIQQVLINLLDNAAQHSPEGREILIQIPQPTGGAAQIKVVDQGKGMPEEIRQRVFEPFFTTRRKGTGLGLAIVKNIIEKHGGTVTIINNDPPPGCTVEISLPLSEGREP